MFADDTSLIATGESSLKLNINWGWKSKTLRLG